MLPTEPNAKQCAFVVQGSGRCPEIGAWITPEIGDATIAAARWCGEHRHSYDVAAVHGTDEEHSG